MCLIRVAILPHCVLAKNNFSLFKVLAWGGRDNYLRLYSTGTVKAPLGPAMEPNVHAHRAHT